MLPDCDGIRGPFFAESRARLEIDRNALDFAASADGYCRAADPC